MDDPIEEIKIENISGEFPLEQWIALQVLVNTVLCEPAMKSTPISDAYKSELLAISEKLQEIIK